MSASGHSGTAPAPDAAHPTVRAYISGFVGSLVLTLGVYLLVVYHALSAGPLVALILVVAVSQFTVQLVFFLHLGSEPRPRWRLLVFLSMVVIVLILVLGSLWIMNSLDSRMSITQQQQYMNSQGGI